MVLMKTILSLHIYIIHSQNLRKRPVIGKQAENARSLEGGSHGSFSPQDSALVPRLAYPLLRLSNLLIDAEMRITAHTRTHAHTISSFASCQPWKRPRWYGRVFIPPTVHVSLNIFLWYAFQVTCVCMFKTKSNGSLGPMMELWGKPVEDVVVVVESWNMVSSCPFGSCPKLPTPCLI